MKKKYCDGECRLEGIEVDLMSKRGVDNVVESLNLLNLDVNYLINAARNIEYLRVAKNGISSRSEFVNEYLLDVVIPYELSMKLANRKGSKLKGVINIGSQYGSVVTNPVLYDNYSVQTAVQYGVAKAALVHLTKELAVRLSNQKILVNCVAYGGVEGRVDTEFVDRYSKLTPLGRMLKPIEIASPIDFLMSDDNSFITGQTIMVDGGWGLW